MNRLKIGLALGSGAARGWSHIGVLNVLMAEGIRPDVIAGSSIGALVGAAFATGHLDRLEAWARDLTWRGMVSLMDLSLSRGGLIRGDGIIAFLEELGVRGSIEELDVPFTAVATDLTTGREVWLQEGPIGSAVHASISMPGIFAPQKRGRHWLLDGGLVNPVPVSACRALGADIIIAVNLNGDLVGPHRLPSLYRREPDIITQLLEKAPAPVAESLSRLAPTLQPKENAPGYFDVLAASINIMQDQITRSRLAGEPPHVLLNPRLAGFNLLDFDRAAEIIAEGEETAGRALPHIRHVMERYEPLA